MKWTIEITKENDSARCFRTTITFPDERTECLPTCITVDDAFGDAIKYLNASMGVDAISDHPRYMLGRAL